VVAGADGGGGGISACGWGPHPCQFQVDLIRAGAVRRDVMIFIYLKMCHSQHARCYYAA
jgi:hypothetical protein